MQAELKPCPFCGGPVEVELTHASRCEINGMRNWWGVRCQNTINLGGTCAIEQVPSASKEAAIERWNRRAPTTATGATSEKPVWGRVCTVADMVRNLLTLEQTAPIYTAFHVDYEGARRCRTRPVIISRERVIDGKWIDSSRKDVPYAHVVWAREGERSEEGADAAIDLLPKPKEKGGEAHMLADVEDLAGQSWQAPISSQVHPSMALPSKQSGEHAGEQGPNQ